ncbi:MAG: SpoVA/SpoVAEb family sporulation membrane protein, partial [Ruminococcaceae bacterium]|nr:SpoVA/SpoVAEb family sporulation membrane protein [Oscillospiraceae bacterium]
TGFGNVLVTGTREAVAEKGWLGILTGPFSAASVGTTAAVISALAVSLVARSKKK